MGSEMCIRDRNKTGLWKTDLQLDAGEYQFRYLVNENEWLNDDAVAAIPNDFGSENSIINIELPKPRKTAAKRTTKKTTNGKAKK